MTTKQLEEFIKELKNPFLGDDKIMEIMARQSSACIELDTIKFNNYNKANVDKVFSSIKKSNENKPITITMTTCKRIDLFTQTVDSFLEFCTDICEHVFEWIVVDDNSSEDDRKEMSDKYPFITFIFKTPDQKGHARSMNLLIESVKTPYIFHIEDDWRFFTYGNFLSQCLDVLMVSPQYGQCLLNRGYGEDFKVSHKICSGYNRLLRRPNNELIRYYIHEYLTGSALAAASGILSRNGYVSSIYWPHFSLRVGLTKTDVFKTVGKFSETASHFELEYAHRYYGYKFLTTYFDNIYCIHTGRKTYERDNKDKLNAYDLNNEKQFGEQPKDLQKREIEHEKAVPEKKIFNGKIITKIKTYIINLERRPNRLQSFRQNNRAELFQYDVFKAVDGKTLKPSQKIQKIFQHNDYKYRRGIVGCAMSHITIWTELLQAGTGGLIIEDDAVLTTNFIHKFIHVLSEAPDADIIFLGHHPYPKYRKESDYDKNKTPIVEHWTRERSITESMGGTTAYYISTNGIKNMLSFINSNSVRNGIDWVMFLTGNINNIYYTRPFLAFADCVQTNPNADSDIQGDFDGVGFKDINEYILNEIKYWGYEGVRNKFDDLLVPEDDKSNIICSDHIPDKKDLITNIYILKVKMSDIQEIKNVPFKWYTVNNYIMTIPENRVTEASMKDKIFGPGYIRTEIGTF